MARPAVWVERAALRENGTVTQRLKTPRRGGETHRVMRPEEFRARLLALIPLPRFPLVRYDGVFAPNAARRAASHVAQGLICPLAGARRSCWTGATRWSIYLLLQEADARMAGA